MNEEQRNKRTLESQEVPYSKSALTPESRGILGLPETAQDHANLSSMVNWAPLYLPLFEQMQPRTIVEIGAGEGDNTRCLAAHCINGGATLHVVDTRPVEDQELSATGHVHFHQQRSLDFLRGFREAEVYFIDGDHNYATLREEIELIAGSESARMLLVHDTGWPCGLVDSFHDPATVEGEVGSHTWEKGPLPWETSLHESGFAAGFVAWREQIGGKRNGLRPAIDDFLASHLDWSGSFHAPFYGLGLLWKKGSFSDELRTYIEELIRTLERVGPVLATLEWNRLLQHLQCQFAGRQWEYQQRVIRALAAENERAGRLWKKQQDWIQHLEGRLRENGIRF